MLERRTWTEVVVPDVNFDNLSLQDLKVVVDELIGLHGKDAFLTYDYYGYDNAYEVNLSVRMIEDDSTYNKRVVQEDLKKKRSEEKAAKKLAASELTKAEQERKLYESLKEKYGDKEA